MNDARLMFMAVILLTAAMLGASQTLAEETDKLGLNFSQDSVILHGAALTEAVAAQITNRFADGTPIILDLESASVDESALVTLALHVRIKEIRITHGEQLLDRVLAAATRMTGLAAIFISETKMTDGAYESLGKLPHLRAISFSGVEFGKVAWIAQIADLEALILYSCTVVGDPIAQVLDLKRLRILGISQTKMALAPDVSAASQLISLTSLNLVGCGITDSQLARLLPYFPRLEELDVSENPLTGKLWTMLENIRSLKELNLTQTQFSNQTVPLLKTFTALEVLVLSDTTVSDEAVDVLLKLPALMQLGISRTKMTVKGVLAVLQSPSLIGLGIEGLLLTDDDMAAIAESGKRQIRHIGLKDNLLTDRSAESIKSMRVLQTLNLMGNQLTPQAIQSLQKALPGAIVAN